MKKIALFLTLVAAGCMGDNEAPNTLLDGAGGAGGAPAVAHGALPPAPKVAETPLDDGLETKTGELRCAAQGPGFPVTCFLYQPDYPPGGRDCTGAPGPYEVNLYTGPNKTGWCVTLPGNMGWWNLNSGNGWFNYFFVHDIEVGSLVPNGWVCYGPNATVGCYPLWAGYNFNYTAPTYANNQPGWQSIYVGP